MFFVFPWNYSRIKCHASEFCNCVPIKKAAECNDEVRSNAFLIDTPNKIFTLFEIASEMWHVKQLCLICDNQREWMEEKSKPIYYSTFILISTKLYRAYWNCSIAFVYYFSTAIFEYLSKNWIFWVYTNFPPNCPC